MAVKVGEAFVEVTARLDEYNKRLGDAEKTLNKFGKKATTSTNSIGASFLKLGKSLFAFTAIIQGVRFVFEKLIRPASDFEEVANKFGVVFKDVGEEAQAAAKELQSGFGLSISESQKLLSNTGDLLTGFGATGKQAIDLSKKVQTLAGDLASFTNIEGGTERASRALTAALLGEREQAKQLGIVIRESDVQARLAAEGKAGLTGEAKLLATAEATLAIATEQSTNAIGDFARSSDSFANQSRTLGALLEDIAVTIGAPLKDALNDGVGSLLENRDAIVEWAGVLVNAFKTLGDFFSMAVRVWKIALKPLLDGFNDTASATDKANSALESLSAFFKEIEPLITLTAEVIGFLLQAVIDFIRILDDVFGPALKKAIEGLGNFKDAVVDIVDEIRGIESVTVTVEKLGVANAQAASETAKHEKKVAALSKAWKKAKEDAKKFVEEFRKTIEAPTEAIERERQENLDNLESFKKRRLITEQEYADTKVAINKEANDKLAEQEALRAETQKENLNTGLSVTSEVLGQLGELFAASDQSRLNEIERRKQKRLQELDVTFNKEKKQILDTEKNKRRQEKKLTALEEKKAKDEEKINKKADKQKANLQRKAFERDKAFKIVGVIVATAQAIMQAFAQLGPIGGAIATALITAFGVAQIALIASTKPPALADGGIVTGDTIARVGEAGTEAVFPLEGARGAKTREMFADDLVNSIAEKSEAATEASIISPEGELTFNFTLNMGGEQLFTTITTGIENREILVDEGALVKR